MPEKQVKKKSPKKDDYERTVRKLADTVRQLEVDVKIIKTRMGL